MKPLLSLRLSLSLLAIASLSGCNVDTAALQNVISQLQNISAQSGTAGTGTTPTTAGAGADGQQPTSDGANGEPDGTNGFAPGQRGGMKPNGGMQTSQDGTTASTNTASQPQGAMPQGGRSGGMTPGQQGGQTAMTGSQQRGRR